MKKSVVVIVIIFIFFAGIFLGKYDFKSKTEKVTNELTLASISIVFDSLANQPIIETKVTPELLWKFGRIGEMKLSPDGKIVVYSVTRHSIFANHGYTDLFSVPAAGGEAKHLTTFAGSESNPRWKPDGTKIGFISDEDGSSQIWEMNIDGTEQIKGSDIPDGINSFEYSPDGTKVLYCKDVKVRKTPQDRYSDLPKTEVYIATELMYRHWNHWEDASVSHVFYSEIIKKNSSEKGIDIGSDGAAEENYGRCNYRLKYLAWFNKPGGFYTHATCNSKKYLIRKYIFQEGCASI